MWLTVINMNIYKKVNFSQCLTKYHAMKTYFGNGGIATLILNLGTRWSWVISFTPRLLFLRYPLVRRLSGPQSHSAPDGEEENISHQFPYRELKPGRPARNLVSILNKLQRLPWTLTVI